ncbi:hypothetical protein DID88_008602 [Monilinia fructigena]|uniref:Uncharacterized protein n=1 Tax=Monilinia fructigena TaxID=38457 RepID=A0A395J5W0_9HELO|nr:hypothetical protein DID88_008602 [Monilinia fructigena]
MGVLEDTPTISDSNIEDIVVVDFYNYAEDNDNNDCDDIALADKYPNDIMEIFHTEFLNAATIPHPATQLAKLHEDSQQSHVLPIIPDTNGMNVPLDVESDKPDEPHDPYDLSSMTVKLFPTLLDTLLHNIHDTHLSKVPRILMAEAIKEKYHKLKRRLKTYGKTFMQTIS